MASRYTKRYTEEFKRDAIALVDSFDTPERPKAFSFDSLEFFFVIAQYFREARGRRRRAASTPLSARSGAPWTTYRSAVPYPACLCG
ncbi:hypothetical protein [Streptomyces sp. SGAir0957]